MPDSPKTADDVKAIVAERQIRFIRFWFTDILGQLKSFSINVEELDDAFESGMGFDGSSITGFNAIEESDMVAIPDPSTFRVLTDGLTGRMICDVVTPDGNPYDGDPRHVLRLALEVVLRDEEREIGVLVPGRLDAPIELGTGLRRGPGERNDLAQRKACAPSKEERLGHATFVPAGRPPRSEARAAAESENLRLVVGAFRNRIGEIEPERSKR